MIVQSFRYSKPLPTKTWIIVITDWNALPVIIKSCVGLLFISKNIGRLKIKAIITNVKVPRSALLASIHFGYRKESQLPILF